MIKNVVQLFLLILLCSCTPDILSQFEGEWIFDKEITLSNIPIGSLESNKIEFISSNPDLAELYMIFEVVDGTLYSTSKLTVKYGIKEYQLVSSNQDSVTLSTSDEFGYDETTYTFEGDCIYFEALWSYNVYLCKR